MNCQTYETASELITTGRKKIARRRPRVLSVRWSPSAIPSPMTFAVMTNANASSRVWMSAPRAAGSSKISWKLSSPTQVACRLIPSQSVNAYHVPAPVATYRKARTTATAGRTQTHGTVPPDRRRRRRAGAACSDTFDMARFNAHATVTGVGRRAASGHRDDALAYVPHAASRSARVCATVFCPVSRPWTSLPRVSTTAGFGQLRFISGKTLAFTLRNPPSPRSS